MTSITQASPHEKFPRAIIADDHPIIGNAVRQILERDTDVIIESSVSSARDLIEALETHPCELVITDFSMPSSDAVDGLPLISTLRRRWPELRIIVLTMVANPAVLQSILDLGANGLINKADAMSELAFATQVVLRGQSYVSHATRVLLDESNSRLAAASNLSPRETEVLRLFASGKTVTEIAKYLNRSVKTISTQKLEAMSKLGLRSDLDIYAYARENGLLS